MHKQYEWALPRKLRVRHQRRSQRSTLSARSAHRPALRWLLIVRAGHLRSTSESAAANRLRSSSGVTPDHPAQKSLRMAAIAILLPEPARWRWRQQSTGTPSDWLCTLAGSVPKDFQRPQRSARKKFYLQLAARACAGRRGCAPGLPRGWDYLLPFAVLPWSFLESSFFQRARKDCAGSGTGVRLRL